MVSTYDDVKEVHRQGARRTGKPKMVVECSSISLEGSAELRADAEAQEASSISPRRSAATRRSSRPASSPSSCSGPEGGVRDGAAVPRHDGHRLELRRRGRARAHRQDLPQRHARRGDPEPVRDHRPRAEGGHAAPRVPRLPEQERDGLDVHALQDAGAREPRLPRHVHARSCCARTSTSASMPAREFEVPMPLTSLTRDLLQQMIGHGMTEQDFSTLLLMQAKASGIELKPENVQVGDGLSCEMGTDVHRHRERRPANHDHRLAAAALVVHAEPRAARVPRGDGRPQLPRAVPRRGIDLPARPGGRRASTSSPTATAASTPTSPATTGSPTRRCA